jgi:uncharacterized protein (TIGR03000 family)
MKRLHSRATVFLGAALAVALVASAGARADHPSKGSSGSSSSHTKQQNHDHAKHHHHDKDKHHHHDKDKHHHKPGTTPTNPPATPGIGSTTLGTKSPTGSLNTLGKKNWTPLNGKPGSGGKSAKLPAGNAGPSSSTLTHDPFHKNQRARLEVLLPHANARVTINGQHSHKTGKVRVFETPRLGDGKAHSYRVRATWHEDGREVHREHTVQVRAGGNVRVDFQHHGTTQAQTKP